MDILVEHPDDVGSGLRFARGFMIAAACSIPIWIALFFLLWCLLS
jgi:hypothetical protein